MTCPCCSLHYPANSRLPQYRLPQSSYRRLQNAKEHLSYVVLVVDGALDAAQGDMGEEEFGWDLESLVEDADCLADVLRKHRTDRQLSGRLAKMRDPTGRTPEEAAAYAAKADEIERGNT